MAVRHVNVVERVFGLSNRCAAGDADALAELVAAYHDDARVESIFAGETAQRGEAALRELLRSMSGSYEDWHCTLDYVQDFGERVLALGALRAVKPGGAAEEHAVGWIFTFRGDRIETVNAYPSYGDALRAATSRSSIGQVKTA